ncbi:MAG: type VI secretion system baseplate subunit TssE [Bryobacteraceae bacterium]
MAQDSHNSQHDMVTLSIIDRIVGDEADVPATRREAVAHLKRNVRRDLEWLLNTRRNPEAAGKEFPELERSVFNYGLPDFTAMSVLSNRERNSLLRALGDCIAYFEPRLKQVRVQLRNEPTATHRTLQFQIEGLLMMDPAPERISFDTTYQMTSGEYQVRGEAS